MLLERDEQKDNLNRLFLSSDWGYSIRIYRDEFSAVTSNAYFVVVINRGDVCVVVNVDETFEKTKQKKIMVYNMLLLIKK